MSEHCMGHWVECDCEIDGDIRNDDALRHAIEDLRQVSRNATRLKLGIDFARYVDSIIPELERGFAGAWFGRFA